MITEVHQEGRFHRLSTSQVSHSESLIEMGVYSMMDPACKIIDKVIRKIGGNDTLEEGSNSIET